MKKIVIVDGGPRKNMNTAQLLQRFAEGAMPVAGWRSSKRLRLWKNIREKVSAFSLFV